MKPRDHKVRFRTEAEIEGKAFEARVKTETLFEYNFSITNVLERATDWTWPEDSKLPEEERKGRLRISYFDSVEGSPPARVKFRPLRLFMDQTTWLDARYGDHWARFVLGHELGHIVLHDHEAKAFSSDPELKIKFAENEYSAEWQADTFAYYFLVPDIHVESLRTPTLISESCGIEIWRAEERISMFRRKFKIRRDAPLVIPAR